MYSITLTPQDITAIRKYNEGHSYADKNLTCENGDKCISDFVTDLVSGKIGSNELSIKINSDNSSCM